jgi:hypothetical protein
MANNIHKSPVRRRGNCSAAADKTRHLFNPVLLTEVRTILSEAEGE